MAHSFWERYLEVFDRVRVVARAARVEHRPEGWQPVTGKNILFQAVPDFHGPWQCLKQYPSIRAAIHSAAPARGAVILRVGSLIANILEDELSQRRYPYALEVVGDPYEVFSPGVVDHPLRPFFQWHFSRRLRRQCRRAIAVAYVTKRALQQRYPTRGLAESVPDVDLPHDAVWGGVFRAHDSNVELDLDDIERKPRPSNQHGHYQLVTVGSLAQLYKGTDVLIEAVARCVHAGFDLKAVIVGGGKYQRELMGLAERVGMSARIQFLGEVPAGKPVRDILDASDLFVLPSRTEGLPRALIEAMARALPCIGSAVGGIPELLDATELVPPGDSVALALKIREVLLDPSRMRTLSLRNLKCAEEYSESALAERRRSFYRYVRENTETWEASQVQAK